MLPYILGYGPSVLGFLGTITLLWFFDRQNRNLVQDDLVMRIGFILIALSFILDFISLVTLS